MSLLDWQTLDQLLQLRVDIGMVMYDLPAPSLTSVDVRDALLDGDRLASEVGLPGLDPHLVG